MHWIKNAEHERALLSMTVLFLLLFPVLFRPFIHGADSVGYYSWVRSAVIERTLDVKDAFHHYSQEFGEIRREEDINRKTASGYTQNQWAPGSSLLWAPAFLIAHAGVLAADALGSNLPADGYSWPYPLAASLASAIYGWMALYLMFSLARRLTGDFPAGLAVLVVWLASPMVFYMYSHPLMSHTNDAFANALFVFAWWKTQKSYSMKGGLARGLAAGLAAWVRPQNAVLIVILGLETFIDLYISFRRKRAWKPAFIRGLATLTGFLLLFLPLQGFWQVIYGSVVTNPYAHRGGRHIIFFRWSAPHLLDVLFSSNRGLFIWAPVTLPALAGLRWLFRENARFAWILAGMFASQLYIISCWYGWSGNVSFGPRFWISQTVIFAIGFSCLVKAIGGSRILWLAFGSLLAAWNFLLIIQYALQTIPRHGPVDLGLMVRNQFTVIPENLPRILRGLLTRGR